MSWCLPPPDPTPDQIRQRCKAIQATWSAAERDRRSRHYVEDRNLAKTCVPEPGWQPPVIHVTPEVAAAMEVGSARRLSQFRTSMEPNGKALPR